MQALALLPSLRATGFRFRPRFDWRGSGLTRPLRSAGWLVLLVLSNQAAYWVTTRLATSSGARAAAEHIEGAGFSAYNNAYTLWMVPHGIVTVSLVTALMPRMSRSAADGDTAAVRRDAGYALRTSGALIVPAACALLALAHPATALVFQHGRTGPEDIAVLAGILMAFAPGLIAFSGQYVLSRSFYALSDTRTPFLLNLMIAGLNAGLSWAAYQLLPARWAVTGMAGGYSLALFAGWALTALVLHRRLTPGNVSGTAPPRPRLWRSATVAAQAGMLAAAVPATLLGLGATRLAAPAGPAVAAGAGALTVAAVFILLARPLRLAEVDSLVTGAVARLRRRH